MTGRSPELQAGKPPRAGIETPLFVGVLAAFVAIICLVLNLLQSEIEAGQKKAEDLQRQISELKVDNAHLTDDLSSQKAAKARLETQLNAWSVESFFKACLALKGSPDYSVKACNFHPDERTLKYDPPLP